MHKHAEKISCEINTVPSLQIFLSNVQPPDFPGSLNFDKFYTLPPLSRSQSLEYLQICMVNIYLLIENM